MEKKSYGNELLHKVLLSVMKDVDKICRENNIRYFLHAGTLLGAINHGGFIPWDDDVDITMFREDYEKFCSILEKEHSDKYFIQTYLTDYYHPDNRMKIRVKGTEFITGSDYDQKLISNGLFIDIAPLYSSPKSSILRKFQKRLIYITDIVIQIKLGNVIPTSLKTKIILKPFTYINRKTLGRFLDFIMKYMQSEKSDQVGTLCCTFRNEYMGIDGYENDMRPKKYYQNPVDIEFEGYKFMTIANWNEDLVRRYGENYMKPYPEEKRITKHGLEDFKVSKEVKERLGI